ncbi:MAG: DUF3244 domain-containing protein [Nanoarchaeota archaeon]|nr:DUF3244 domain-containing protein [Nanoarchaeota archaeon]
MIMIQQPKELYNLGDVIEMNLKISTSVNLQNTLHMYLICNGLEKEFFMDGINLLAGGEKSINPTLILNKKRIERLPGICKIKYFLEGASPSLTNEFKVSDLIFITLKSQKTEFSPEETILIEGEAVKENGMLVQGIAELNIVSENQSGNLSYLGTVNNGFFSISFALPKETSAGQHLVRLRVYEKDSDNEITNNGFTDYGINIIQISTSLEIIFENQEVEPGTNLKVKSILHDQTGEKINSSAIITIKNENDKILEQIEISTGEFLEFPIKYNQAPDEWTVYAISNKISNEAKFRITEKEDVKIELINRTVTITNIGNVYYNNTVLVKIGNDTINIDVRLDIDKAQKYLITAPNGEYNIEIIADGKSHVSKSVMLTGKVIDVKEVSSGVARIMKHPLVWIFIIVILGLVALILFKRRYKKSFFGYLSFKKKGRKEIPLRKGSLIKSRNPAELSLSIKGENQNSSLICLKIKNLKEIESTKGNAEESLQKIVNFAEEQKAATYETQGDLFFILAPIKTKTFKNEKSAIEISQKIREIITNHNRLFKQKINYGVSLNYGTIIAKQEKEVLKFMSMGTLMANSKKAASISKEDTVITEKMKEKLGSDIRTEKHEEGKTVYYTIKEIKNLEDHQKFISGFIKRLEGKK